MVKQEGKIEKISNLVARCRISIARETKDVVERFEELDRMYYIFIQGLNDKI